MRKLALALALILAAGAARAAYPERPVTVVVPFAAGGPTDTVARLVAEVMGRDLGQQLVVENVAGAAGTLGAAQVAKAEPDGYTLLLYHIGMATTAVMYRSLPYDATTAFAPIGLVTEVPMTIVARKDFPPATAQELVQTIKAEAANLTIGNAGIGSASHLCGMLLMSSLEAQMTTVPYKGTGPAMTDLVGGQIDLLCDQTTNTAGQITGGAIKAYAVTTPERLPAFPDLPTTAEAGMPGVALTIWHGLYAPAGTPQDVVDRLAGALQKALADPTIVGRFAELGTAPSPAADATPAALQARVTSEIERWRPIVEAAGAYAD